MQSLIIAEVISHFFPEWEVKSFTAINNGLINSTFRVDLSNNVMAKTFLLQRINHTVFKRPAQIMDNIQKVGDFLSRQNYPKQILTLQPTVTKKLYHQDPKGNYWRVFNYLDNTLVFDQIEKPTQAFEAARTFGEYLAALWDFDPLQLHESIPNFHHPPSRFQIFQQVIGKNSFQRNTLAQTAIDFILEQQFLLNRFSLDDLPIRVTHNDTKINNILFDAQGENGVCVIDLDTLMPGYIVFDFGDMVRTFTNRRGEEEQELTKIEMDFALFEQVSQGFLATLGPLLTIVEKQHLVNGALLITYEQSIRFLTDYLAGDVYYSTQYPDHNLKRAQNQIQLLQSMLHQETAMKQTMINPLYL